MPHSLPPLNALRVFEASARLSSFKKASEELFVTPSAVSQQIKTLEDHLGVILFNRSANGISLTAEGQKLLPKLETVFAEIASAIADIKQDSRVLLRLSAPPALAAIWLSARLTQFEAEHSDIVTNLHSALEKVNFSSDGFDCAIRVYFDEQMDEGLTGLAAEGIAYEKLLTSELYCVCNPNTLVDKRGVRRVPEHLPELNDFNLLHFRDYTTWRLWAESAQNSSTIEEEEKPDLYTTAGIINNTVDGLCKALTSGQGIALVDSVIYHDERYANQLKPLFAARRNNRESDKMSYFFIAPEKNWQEPKVQALREWLRTEGAKVVGHYAFEHQG